MTTVIEDFPDEPAVSPAATREAKDRRRAFLLLTPGVLWMVLFMLMPLVMVIYVSFWTQSTFAVEPTLTTASWERFLSSPTYLTAIGTTLKTWIIVLLATIVVGYPVALFIGLFVKNRTLQTALLVACVIPFWTSFLIRVIAWRPMLGTEGAINIILLKLGIVSEPLSFLLFSEFSVYVGMTQIYCVFMVGPITFMIARIDDSIIEAARDLGASFGTIFRRIVLPLSLPGVIVGTIFVSVMVLGEFATAASLSGRKVNLLGNIIVSQVGSLKWAFAAVAGVVLTVIITAVITLALRVVDIRKEM
ncbi:putative spermidine/putrescine transport system permease protein [Salinihabitans flavidus]|uniref:Putative spermidine/putrescine transport system permease protein n=1 Tax=Salinihabitans flavidus TaxID=569882 RepID=A0A1H8P9Y7_9RHOB|nr:ABC transporter permease [Salinihabitans flavidus]SEO38611.1 putative spermidine/putrescine transport system permease protein [Salinihabitans flavidus]